MLYIYIYVHHLRHSIQDVKGSEKIQALQFGFRYRIKLRAYGHLLIGSPHVSPFLSRDTPCVALAKPVTCQLPQVESEKIWNALPPGETGMRTIAISAFMKATGRLPSNHPFPIFSHFGTVDSDPQRSSWCDIFSDLSVP